VTARRRIAWLDHGWSALVLVAFVYFLATAQMIAEIINSDGTDHSLWPTFLGTLIYVALAALTYWLFVRVRPSLPALAIAILGICVTLTALVGRVLFADVHGEPTGQLLIMGIVTLGIFGAGVWFLRMTGRDFAARRKAAS
jgi:uncharacterized membrane protein